MISWIRQLQRLLVWRSRCRCETSSRRGGSCLCFEPFFRLFCLNSLEFGPEDDALIRGSVLSLTVTLLSAQRSFRMYASSADSRTDRRSKVRRPCQKNRFIVCRSMMIIIMMVNIDESTPTCGLSNDQLWHALTRHAFSSRVIRPMILAECSKI